MPDVHPAVPAAARERAFLEEAPLQPEDKLRVVVVLLQRPVPMAGSEGGGIGGSGQAGGCTRAPPQASLSLAPKWQGHPLGTRALAALSKWVRVGYS